MTWWTSSRIAPKMKSRFIVNFGTFFLPNIKSITKPSLEFATKEYKLLNHTFNYPGTAKWNPVEVKFICMNPSDIGPITTGAKNADTADLLWEMIKNSGYYYPSSMTHSLSRKGSERSTISTAEKASTVANSFGEGLFGKASYLPGGSPASEKQRIVIQQISSGTESKDGINYESAKVPDSQANAVVTEQWELINPIIKSVNFGDLSYDVDELVEYSMTIVYDYAIYSGKSGKPLINSVYQTF